MTSSKHKVSYKDFIWPILIAIAILLYFSQSDNKTTTGNKDVDSALKDERIERPNSGEINFNKE